MILLEERHFGLSGFDIILLDLVVALHVGMYIYILNGGVQVVLFLPSLLLLLLGNHVYFLVVLVGQLVLEINCLLVCLFQFRLFYFLEVVLVLYPWLFGLH